MASESVLASRDTLVRYSNPVVVSKHEDKPHSPLGFQEPHGLSAAGPSKPDTAPSPMSEKAKSTEEVLNCILPPREWKENGELWRQTVSSEPATREDVKKLGEQLDTGLQQQQARETGICAVRRRLFGQCFVLNVKDVKKLGEQLDTGLQQQQARETGICAVRRRLFGQCFDEIIRQVTVNCCERGLLLLRVRDEMKMTIAAYQTLYESSIAFGIRKALQAEQGKSDMEETISELKDLKTNLERQVAELRAKAEQVERRATELRQAEEKKHAEEIDFLKKTNQQLKAQLEGIIAPKK